VNATKNWRTIHVALSLVPVVALLVFWWPDLDYYHHFRVIGGKLRSLPGVTIVGSWKHEDITLEDFGYAVRVRNCPPVSVNFYEGNEWHGLFERIDGIVVRTGDYDRPYKVLSVPILKAKGLAVENLPNVIANLEAVLNVADAAQGVADNWPTPSRHYVIMDYPIGEWMTNLP
jgi:hypothetical protein